MLPPDFRSVYRVTDIPVTVDIITIQALPSSTPKGVQPSADKRTK